VVWETVLGVERAVGEFQKSRNPIQAERLLHILGGAVRYSEDRRRCDSYPGGYNSAVKRYRDYVQDYLNEQDLCDRFAL